MQNIVFGPILSRRFGISLGVDLSPSKKQCNFDCLYCEIGGAKTVEKMGEIVPLEEVLNAIKMGLEKHQEVEVLSITASGEPTLYPYFFELSSELKTLTKNRCKTLVLSNGSRFGDPLVAKGLLNFDIVKFSLDCVSEKCFKRLDRPYRNLEIGEILRGIEEFALCFEGELVGEVLVIEKLNDNLEEMQKIANFMRRINVSRIDLGSLDRPPAYAVHGVSLECLESLVEAFDGLCVSIPFRNQRNIQSSLKDKKELLEIIARRPIAEDEFSNLFDASALSFLDELRLEGKICIKSVANMKFFALKS